ncbi:DNA-directed RNA polymerase subunit omega [Trichothermofontia sp.]
MHFTLEQETFLFLITPIPASFMQKRNQIDTSKIMYQAEELISAASNRYRITVQVANRAKRRRYEDFDSLDDPLLKPVIRAIIEMSDELTQPEIIGE